MALIKEVKTTYGVVASYWRLDYATISPKTKEVNFTLGLYLNKNEKQAFDVYVMTDLMGRDVNVEIFNKYFGTDKGVVYKDWQTACYSYLKDNVPFFADAKDDPEEIALLTKEK